MFKLHKPHLSGSIHSGHFMVSRLDDDDDEEEDGKDPADDSSESERDNANSVEIDVNNPDDPDHVSQHIDIVDYSRDVGQVVSSASTIKNHSKKAHSVNAKRLALIDHQSNDGEHLTNWNDLDRPLNGKHAIKHHQYLTYYTSLVCESSKNSSKNGHGQQSSSSSSIVPPSIVASPAVSQQLLQSSTHILSNPLQNIHHVADLFTADHSHHQHDKDLSAKGINSQLNQLHQHHQHIQDQDSAGTSSHQLIQLQSLQQQQLHQHLQQLHQQQQQQHHLQHYHHQHSQHQHQHAVTIDTSLTKLLECMSLYYSSKLTSPKWKSFKGLKLRLKYKIRLNNLIWRAWFLQCIRGRRPTGCQFTAPVETDVHKKSETIVLEGKYWKRKEKAIVDEYKKWRIFHKQKSQMSCFRPVSLLTMSHFIYFL